MEMMLRIKTRYDCPYKSLNSDGCAISGQMCILDEKITFIDGLPQLHKQPCILELAPKTRAEIEYELNNSNPFYPFTIYTEEHVDFWKKGVMWGTNIQSAGDPKRKLKGGC